MSIEREAADYVARVVKTLGLRPDTSPRAVATAAMGADCLRVLPMRAQSAIMRVRGQWQIVLDKKVPPARASWLFAWQLSSWLLRTDGIDPELAQKLRSPIAAELLMPRDVASRACKTARPEDVARVFHWPLAATLLREAELFRVPTSLLLPSSHVRVRGDDAGRLPTEPEAARALAQGPAVGVKRFQVPEGIIVRLL